MKALFKIICVSMFLLFCTAQAGYAFSTEKGSTPKIPTNQHQTQLDRNNDKALVIEQINLGLTEIASNSHEDLLPNSLFLKFFNTRGSQPSLKSSANLNYLTYSATICPALSGLEMIFPFHLFP